LQGHGLKVLCRIKEYCEPAERGFLIFSAAMLLVPVRKKSDEQLLQSLGLLYFPEER